MQYDQNCVLLKHKDLKYRTVLHNVTLEKYEYMLVSLAEFIKKNQCSNLVHLRGAMHLKFKIRGTFIASPDNI
jgi:hypothetical protein